MRVSLGDLFLRPQSRTYWPYLRYITTFRGWITEMNSDRQARFDLHLFSVLEYVPTIFLVLPRLRRVMGQTVFPVPKPLYVQSSLAGFSLNRAIRLTREYLISSASSSLQNAPTGIVLRYYAWLTFFSARHSCPRRIRLSESVIFPGVPLP